MQKQSVAGVLGLALALQITRTTGAANVKQEKPAPTLTSLASPPAVTDSSASLMVFDRAKPVTVVVGPTTVIGGICQSCQQVQCFTPGEAGKKCQMCSCGETNATCIAWKHTRNSTWQEMFQVLPRGVGLQAVFVTPDQPGSAIKSLIVDRREVLLAVTGLDQVAPDKLQSLVKSVGGKGAQLADHGRQLKIDLKDDWMPEKESKLEKTLATVGGKVAFDPSPAPAH